MQTPIEILAKAWLVYQGMTGTKKQIDKTVKQLSYDQLKNMLAQRNIFFN
jgi:hypothetical protein